MADTKRREQVLQTMRALSEEAQTLITTFTARMNTLYDHKKTIKILLNTIHAHKQDPGEGTRKSILDLLNTIKKSFLPSFQALHPELAELTGKKQAEVAQEELHDFEQLQKDLEDPSLGPSARQKMLTILTSLREEVKQERAAANEVEHLKDTLRLAEGFVYAEQELIAKEMQLIQKTEKLAQEKQPASECDSIAYEWRTFLSDFDTLLRQEKIDVIDHLGPLFKQKTTIADRVDRLLQPFAWIRKKRKPTPEELQAVREGVKITKEDIARDIETFTTPGETQQYNALLMRHFDLLDEKARRILAGGGFRAGTREISEKRKLTGLAYIDPLTGLYRRVVFDTRLPEQISIAKRASQPFALLLIDGDHFKQYNDTYGHHIGDRVLIFMSRIIKNSLREEDSGYRWGGEEFIVLLPNTPKDGALLVAKRVLTMIREEGGELMKEINPAYAQQLQLQKKEPITGITVSIGVATFPEDGNTAEDILRAADARLYSAKEGGRNRIAAQNSVIK